MLEREAMWLNFEAEQPFAVKIYTGSVNAVSGEPMIEDLGTLYTGTQQFKMERPFKIILSHINNSG